MNLPALIISAQLGVPGFLWACVKLPKLAIAILVIAALSALAVAWFRQLARFNDRITEQIKP